MIKIKSRKSNQKNFFHFQQDFELFHLQFLTPLMKVELVAVVKPQMIFHQYSSHNNFGYFHRIYIHGLSSTNFVMTMQKDGRKMALLDIRMQRHGNKCVNKKKNSFKLRPSLYSTLILRIFIWWSIHRAEHWIEGNLFFWAELNLF